MVRTVGIIIAGGYVMSYLVKIEEENVQKQLGAKGLKVDKKGKVVPELKIHELRAETYNGMIRLLKRGCRTIVLIVDRESKEKLVQRFYKHGWLFRRNKTLMFGFMYIEKGLQWYKKILNLVLPEPREININPKSCIGMIVRNIIVISFYPCGVCTCYCTCCCTTVRVSVRVAVQQYMILYMLLYNST